MNFCSLRLVLRMCSSSFVEQFAVEQGVFQQFGPFDGADFFAVGAERVELFKQVGAGDGFGFEVGEQLFFGQGGHVVSYI